MADEEATKTTADYAIAEESLNGKGVSAQSNPMELPEDEAKAVFDQISKEIIIPAFNDFVAHMAEQLGLIDLTKDEDKPISSNMQKALDKKVDKEHRTGSDSEYKVLSDNNLTDALKQALEENTAARHGHENKTLLDGLKQTDIDNWNGGNVLTKDNTKEYTPTGIYQPATKKYVDDKVVAIGAADMTQSVYDPTGQRKDIFLAIAEAKADSKYITDDATGEKYYWGMENGCPCLIAAEDETEEATA